jgi:hypothetical protein
MANGMGTEDECGQGFIKMNERQYTTKDTFGTQALNKYKANTSRIPGRF